jgi:hypothetical protein
MKIGLRKPSLRKLIAARTSVKRYVRHSLGLKAPRGWGWVTNPKKAAYSRIYNRTTVSVESLGRGRKSKQVGQQPTSAMGCLVLIALFLLDICVFLQIRRALYGLHQ